MQKGIWQRTLVNPSCTIRESINILNDVALGMVLVVEDGFHLLGIVTDGDIRRGLLRGISLEQSVQKVMNTSPVVVRKETPKQELLALMENDNLVCIPIVDGNMRIVNVEILKYIRTKLQYDHWIFLMAGGFGTRLKPLTDYCPKPLLKLNGKPVLEKIIEDCKSRGFVKFYLSVHYKSDMIMDYFGDGSTLGVEIKYIQEDKPLGTGGALSLLPELDKPILMMNGDVLTNVDFGQLLHFHLEAGAEATVCVREHELQVPYGVVQTDDYRFVKIIEKPVHHFFINAGIYVLSLDVVNNIKNSGYLDMPDLLNQLVAKNKKVAIFPVHEYWLDMGKVDDFKRAQLELR